MMATSATRAKGVSASVATIKNNKYTVHHPVLLSHAT